MLIRNCRKLLWGKQSRDPFFSRQVCLSNREEWQEQHVSGKFFFFVFIWTVCAVELWLVGRHWKSKYKASWKECFLEVLKLLLNAISWSVQSISEWQNENWACNDIPHHLTWRIKVAILSQKKTANLSLFVKFQMVDKLSECRKLIRKWNVIFLVQWNLTRPEDKFYIVFFLLSLPLFSSLDQLNVNMDPWSSITRGDVNQETSMNNHLICSSCCGRSQDTPISLPIHIPQLVKSLLLNITQRLRKGTLSGWTSPYWLF